MKTIQVALLVLVAAVAANAQPVVTFEKDRVVATGVTRGGNVLWFAQAHERPAVYVRLVNRTKVMADANGDGRVEYPLLNEVAIRSVWVAVDLATGEAGIGRPAGVDPAVRPFTSGMLKERGEAATVIDMPQPSVEFLLVRPGVGYWRDTRGDGNPGCGVPRTAGHSAICLGELKPASEALPKVTSLAPGDVLLAIDQLDLACYHDVYGRTF